MWRATFSFPPRFASRTLTRGPCRLSSRRQAAGGRETENFAGQNVNSKARTALSRMSDAWVSQDFRRRKFTPAPEPEPPDKTQRAALVCQIAVPLEAGVDELIWVANLALDDESEESVSSARVLLAL